MSAAMERRLAKLERASAALEEDDTPVFFCLRPGDPEPDSSRAKHAVFIMRLQDGGAPAECPSRPSRPKNQTQRDGESP